MEVTRIKGVFLFLSELVSGEFCGVFKREFFFELVYLSTFFFEQTP